MMEVRKIGGFVTVSRHQMLDAGLVKPTAEEQREIDESRAEMERLKQAATVAWPVFVAALDAVTDPVARAVLDLHSADQRGECTGCEFDGWEAERPVWPCKTITTVAAAVGIAVPPDLHLADQCHKWNPEWREHAEETSAEQ